MGSVVFEYQFETDTDVVRELEIEVTLERAYRGYKLVSVDSISESGHRLSQSAVEDLTEEIGEEELLNAAIDQGSDEEEALDEQDVQLMEELNIDVG